MKLLQTLLGSANKIVPGFLKDHDKKLSSKRIFGLGGGGTLIYKGLDFLNVAIETNNQTALYSGCACILVGGLLAFALSGKITEMQIGDKENKEG